MGSLYVHVDALFDHASANPTSVDQHAGRRGAGAKPTTAQINNSLANHDKTPGRMIA
jgi:hypothetical protein